MSPKSSGMACYSEKLSSLPIPFLNIIQQDPLPPGDYWWQAKRHRSIHPIQHFSVEFSPMPHSHWLGSTRQTDAWDGPLPTVLWVHPAARWLCRHIHWRLQGGQIYRDRYMVAPGSNQPLFANAHVCLQCLVVCSSMGTIHCRIPTWIQIHHVRRFSLSFRLFSL